MKFFVDPYMDQIKQKPDAAFDPVFRPWVFDTEAEARGFVIHRAEKAAQQAQQNLAKAQARYRKCIRRFGKGVS